MSGAKDISYYNFIKKFLSFIRLKKNLVQGINSRRSKIKLVYNHPVTALSMQYTTIRTGLKPIDFDKIYKCLYKHI